MKIEEFTNEFGQVQRVFTPRLVPLQTVHVPGSKLNKYDTTSISYFDPLYGKQVVSERHINPEWQREHDRKEMEMQAQRVKRMLQVEGADPKERTIQMKPKAAVFESLADEY